MPERHEPRARMAEAADTAPRPGAGPADGPGHSAADAQAASWLSGLAALGPFFAVQLHAPGAAPAAPWRPGGELTRPSEALAARIEAVRAALARTARGGPGPAGRDGRSGRGAREVEPRVAGSAAHLGLIARLIAPALGAAVLRCPVDLRPAGLWWCDELGGALPLSLPADGGAGPGRADPGWERTLLDETIEPVTAAVARLVPLSGRVLWGNVASAVSTAAVQVARQRPDLAPEAWRAARRLLADPRLGRESCPPGPGFRRSSCCLLYRLRPGEQAAICGDCVLGGPRATREPP